jgi:hypothetical protein
MIDETTLTGYKIGFNKPEVGDAGNDAVDAIFHTTYADDGQGGTFPVIHPEDTDGDHSSVSGAKIMIERKKQEGNTEVIPTVPVRQ